MWQYVFRMLRRQPGKSTLVCTGFLLAACALILLSATTQTTLVEANQIISQNWRPTYDLVVLPQKAQIPTNQNIPPDLLEGYSGGISMQQYEQVKQIPGIEVAAPIAYVGYVNIPTPPVYFANYPIPAGYYQLSWTVNAFNGQQNIVEAQQSDTIYVDYEANCGDFTNSSFSKVLEVLHLPEAYCAPKDNPFVSFSPPGSTGTFLLAAIDPAEEDRLVHLDKAVRDGRMLTDQDTIHLDKRIPDNPFYSPYLKKRIPIDAIPLLVQQQLPGQISLNATLTLLYDGPLTPEEILANGGLGYIHQQPNQQTIFNGSVPILQNDPQRFSGKSLQWNGYAWQAPLTVSKNDVPDYYLDLSSAYTPTGLTYQPATAPDGRSAYALVAKGVQGSEVAFRDFLPLHTLKSTDPRSMDVVYNYETVGQFAGNELAAQIGNPLNWLPENTYTAPPVVLRYDAHGHSVSATTLLPTTNPASYIEQPPLALTTLDAARQLIGDRSISAIRVRVAGVATPSQESWKHIQQVAQQIRQQTGLKVQVTLGSSPQPTLVYVPGAHAAQYGLSQDIAPVGWVEERWIHIGVGLIYLSQLGQTRLLLLGAVLGVCLGYLAVAFSALVSAQRKELAVLNALGWRPWQPIRLFLMQAFVLAIGGGLAGLGLALLIAALLEAIPIWIVVIWTIPVMLAFALVSVLYPLWKIWHIRPAEVLRTGSAVTSGKARLLGSRIGARLMPIGTLVLRNLGRSRPRALIVVVSLFCSVLLLMLMFNGILALRQTLLGTLLGDYVLLQTAVPQIAGCTFAIVLTFLSVADLLLLQVRERQQEIGLLDVAARLTSALAPLREMDRAAELHRQSLLSQLRARPTKMIYSPVNRRLRLSVFVAALLLVALAVGMMSRGELGVLLGNVTQLWHTSTSLDQVKGIDIASLERPHAGLRPLPLLPTVLPNDTQASAYGVITDASNPNILTTFVADYQIGGQQVLLYEQPSDLPFSSSTAKTVSIGMLEGQWFQDNTGNNALQWYQHNMVCQITSKLPVNRLVALASTFQPIKSWDLLV